MGSGNPSNNWLQTIENFAFLDRNFNRLFAACPTEEQRSQLRRAYVNSRDSFWEARPRIFIETDPLVKEMGADLKKAEEKIEGLLQSLQNIAQVLNVITAAVHLGSSLVTLGSALVA